MSFRWSAFRARLFVGVIALAAIACDAGLREVVAGEDACRYCRMTIDDARFGALVKTDRGKIETFDSIECLASFVSSLPATSAPKGVWVADFSRPSQWIHVDSARFVQTSSLKSPMGRELAAFGTDRSDAELIQAYGGRVLDWRAVQSLVKSTPFASSGAASHAH